MCVCVIKKYMVTLFKKKKKTLKSSPQANVSTKVNHFACIKFRESVV